MIRMRLLLSFILLSGGFISCKPESECDLKPIPSSVFNLTCVKSVVVKNGNETDSLIVSEKIDHYEKTSYKGLMNYRACEHYKGYKARFKEYEINVSLHKNADETLELDVIAFGSCGNITPVRVNEDELLLNKEYFFNAQPNCEAPNSIFKKIILRGYFIKSITTTDNETWVVQ